MAQEKKNRDTDAMEAALRDVNKGMSYRLSAKTHGVKRTTLMDKHKKKTPLLAKRGPSTVFSIKDENVLVNWVKVCSRTGFPLSKETFLASVNKLATELNLSFGSKSFSPGRKWFSLFQKRHPELVFRSSQNLTIPRRSITQQDLDSWHNEVGTYLRDEKLLDILDDPRRVFNTDETAFFLNPKPGKVLAEKGCKTVYTAAGNDEKFNITVLLSASAAGKIPPPMVVYRYHRIPQHITENIPPGWAIGRSPSGWMTQELFYEYISNIFLPWVKEQEIELPILLFMDGHSSHMSLPLTEFCRANKIELVALFPNATHLLQPMDVAVFHGLKSAWRQKIQEWRIDHDGQHLRKQDFAPLLDETLKSISTQSVENGFRKCGLVPWSRVLLPSSEQLPPKTSNLLSREEKSFVKILEKEIGAEKIKLFQQSGETWEGTREDVSLYKIWRKYQSVPANETATDEGEQQSSNLLSLELSTEHHANTSTENVTPPRPPVDLAVPSTSKEVPTPFRRTLFWPGETSSAPKRRREKLPAVVTSDQMIQYFDRKKEKKLEEEKKKEEKKIIREKKIEEKKKKSKTIVRPPSTSSSTSIASLLNLVESSSEWEEHFSSDEMVPEVLTPNSLKTGDFVLVEFLGGRRNATKFVYLCTISYIDHSDNIIEVTGLKSIDFDKKSFILVKKDVSYISFSQIIGKVEDPSTDTVGTKITYKFPKRLPVKEKLK